MAFVTRSTDFTIPEWPKWVHSPGHKSVIVHNQEEEDAWYESLEPEQESAPKRRGRPPKAE